MHLEKVVKLFFSFQVVYLFCGLQNALGDDSGSVETLIKTLVQANKKPTVVYVNTNEKPSLHSHVHGNKHQDYRNHLQDALDGDETRTLSGGVSTYWLDYLLRSTQDLRSSNQTLDRQLTASLHNALRVQCQVLDKCKSKCAKDKPKCQFTCTIVFDDGKKCKPKKPKTTTKTPRDECADSTSECYRK